MSYVVSSRARKMYREMGMTYWLEKAEVAITEGR
jgi:hypothetical protein